MQHCSYPFKCLSSPWRTMHPSRQKGESSSFLVFKMTGTVQRAVCHFHLCQLPLKCAQLPQPATMEAVGRPLAEQWIRSPFWFGAVRTLAVIDFAPRFWGRQPRLLPPAEKPRREEKWETELATSWGKRICAFRNVSFVVASFGSHPPFIPTCPACRQEMLRWCSQPGQAVPV